MMNDDANMVNILFIARNGKKNGNFAEKKKKNKYGSKIFGKNYSVKQTA